MAAWSDDLAWAPERYDREEAADFEQGFYENWGGPTVDAVIAAGEALLAAVDSVFELLPVEGEPTALGSACGADNRVATASTARPSSPSSTPEGLTPVRVRRRGFA